MSKFRVVLSGAVAVLLSVGFSPANAGSISVTYFNNFTENAGVGISFSDPFASDSINAISEFRDLAGAGTANFPSGTVPFGADYTGAIGVATTGLYNFTFGSDDAGYLFVDGILVDARPGARGFNTDSVSINLSAGTHPFEVQYDNVECCGAVVELAPGEGVSFVSATPLPAALPLFASGLAGFGWLARRRRKQAA